MKWIASFVLVLLIRANGFATNYYLSENGNDANRGTKENPWRHLNKFNELAHLAHQGDSVFLERGSTFHGTLIILTSGIYFGAYGTGSKPVISGGVELKTWALFKNNIWSSNCLNCVATPSNFFMDGESQMLGRYPNKDYLPIGAYLPDLCIIEDNLSKFPNGFWTDAELVIRSSRFTIDKLPIADHKSQSFQLSKHPSYMLQPGFGYFIQNHLSTLDQHGEWFFDMKTRQLYVYLDDGFLPNQHEMVLSNMETGLTSRNATNLVMENIVFDQQNQAGIRLIHSDSAQIKRVNILNSGKNGIEISSCRNPTVENTFIQGSNNNGVDWNNNEGGTFSNNTILRTGLHPGRGESGNGAYIAIYMTSSGPQPEKNILNHNHIDSTGYSGIDFRTGNTTIENNTITNFCLTKDDGAGIYTWKNAEKGNIIENNTIRNGVGSGSGTVNPGERYASGIYIDDHSKQILIKGNSVSNCAMAGIFIHNASQLMISENTLTDNGSSVGTRERGQLYIKLDNLEEQKSDMNLALEVAKNKYIATHTLTYCLFLSVKKNEDLFRLGTFKENVFTALHPYQAVVESKNPFEPCLEPEVFTLAQWQVASSNEKGSTFVPSATGENSNIPTIELFSTKYNSALDGWMTWPARSFIEKEQKRGSTSFSLKMVIPAGLKEALLYHPGIYFDPNKVYRLQFSATSVSPGTIEFVPLMANSPWLALGKYACFPVSNTYRTFVYYFKCTDARLEGRANFKSTSTFWIRDISLHEVPSPITSVR